MVTVARGMRLSAQRVFDGHAGRAVNDGAKSSSSLVCIMPMGIIPGVVGARKQSRVKQSPWILPSRLIGQILDLNMHIEPLIAVAV